MSKLHSSSTIIKVLLSEGFAFVSQKGSHKKFRKANKTVIVPDPRKEIPMGTFRSILRQSGMDELDFK